uniref:Polymerase (DNA-directed), delta interacting protein 3 n=1 Tax=Sinocyclocheilus rhinocerous TaxID=307959 RepID=A0A673HAY3_9TELE
MADLSLDEVIRRRSFNARGVSKRPIYGRGAGPVGRAFDARQMIGSGDVRQRLGVKDAREKLGQKDARFRIRGRGAGAVQDARQLLNSRKQQQAPPPIVDVRDRLSLKRSVPTASNQSAAFLKITKTIQEDDGAVVPNKQMKITTANHLQTRVRITHTFSFFL